MTIFRTCLTIFIVLIINISALLAQPVSVNAFDLSVGAPPPLDLPAESEDPNVLRQDDLRSKIYSQTFNTAEGTYRTDQEMITPGATIWVTVNRAIRYMLGILGVLAVIMIVYAGFIWLTAGGNDQQLQKAKKILRQAIIGLIIISFAYAITAFVFTLIRAPRIVS